MHRAKYQDQPGTAWQSMMDADVWMFQADAAERAQPVTQAELRFESKPCERPFGADPMALRLIICVLALLVLLVFLLTDGWSVMARVATGGFIGWSLGWTQRKGA